MKLVQLFEQESSLDGIIQKHQAQFIIDSKTLQQWYNDCSSYLNVVLTKNTNEDKVFLYRGWSKSHTSLTKLLPRVRGGSLTESNFLFNLMSEDVIPGWEKFPKRNQSAFFTTDPYYAEEFGHIVLVGFPTNDSKVGITPRQSHDFNNEESWMRHGVDMRYSTILAYRLTFGIMQNHLAIWYNPDKTTWDDILKIDNIIKEHYTNVTNVLEQVKHTLDKHDAKNDFGKFIDIMINKQFESYADLLKYCLNPIPLGFVATTPSNIPKHIEGDFREVWVDNDYYVVSKEEAGTLLTILKEAKSLNLL